MAPSTPRYPKSVAFHGVVYDLDESFQRVKNPLPPAAYEQNWVANSRNPTQDFITIGAPGPMINIEIWSMGIRGKKHDACSSGRGSPGSPPKRFASEQQRASWLGRGQLGPEVNTEWPPRKPASQIYINMNNRYYTYIYIYINRLYIYVII